MIPAILAIVAVAGFGIGSLGRMSGLVAGSAYIAAMALRAAFDFPVLVCAAVGVLALTLFQAGFLAGTVLIVVDELEDPRAD